MVIWKKNISKPFRQAIQDETIILQADIQAKNEEIAALQGHNVDCLEDEVKNNGITIIAKSNDLIGHKLQEVEYPYISVCGQHGYGKHKTRVLFAHS